MRLAFAVLALLAGCQTPCVAPPPRDVTQAYHCSDGSRLVATFAGERATIVQAGYVDVELPARMIGAGYRYAGGGAELRGQAQGIHWVRPGAIEMTCTRIR
ncbi:MAG: hypothetical protein JNM59_10890 [Hyphomonadaceae bacterium]|nr:hypothetical protein [Hyphomonadaceae bacterium]